MAKLRRMEQVGAVFTEDLSSVNSVKKRGFTVTGNPTITEGPLGKALDFDGTNDYITLGADIEPELRFDGSTQDFSISCWIKRDATGIIHTIIDKRSASNNGWVFWIRDGDKLQFHLGTKDAVSTNTIDTNWHHVAYTADRDGNGQIYIDGSPDGDIALSSESLSTTINSKIARVSYTNAFPFNGAIKNLMIFDRALTQAEITALATNNPFDYSRIIWNDYNIDGVTKTYAPLNSTQKTNIKNNLKSDVSTSLGLTQLQLDDFGDGIRW